MKLSLPDDQPLTDEDRHFLQSIYCQVPPGKNICTVDLTSLKTAEKIHGYAIMLKRIDGKKLNAVCALLLFRLQNSRS